MSSQPIQPPTRIELVYDAWKEYAVLPAALIAFILVNTITETYKHFMEAELVGFGPWFGDHYHFTVHETAFEIALAVIFAKVGIEIVEELRHKTGNLYKKEDRKLPVAGVLGGMIVPGGMYILLTRVFVPEATQGFPTPMATDIVFSLMIVRWVFPGNSRILTFLLTLAVLDDIGGVIVVAIFGGSVINLLAAFAILAAIMAVTRYFALHAERNSNNRVARRIGNSTAFYVIMCVLAWYTFLRFGLEAALAPLFPLTMAKLSKDKHDTGTMEDHPIAKDDPMAMLAHNLEAFMPYALTLFGLVAGAIVVESAGDFTHPLTLITQNSLLFGKTVGIVGFIWLAERIGWVTLPKGLTYRKILIVSIAASIGFTVSLFVSGVFFEGTSLYTPSSLGAFESLPVGVIAAIVVAKVLGEGRFGDPSTEMHDYEPGDGTTASANGDHSVQQPAAVH